MREIADSGLRILAVYERRAGQNDETPGGQTWNESLRVDGKGLIPRASPNHMVQITIEGDVRDHRFPVPAEFNRLGYFIVKSADLPVEIPYEKSVVISIIENSKRGENLLAKTPLRYRTL
jgi:hypothetical protein